jgi:hypothetical protein
VAALKTGGILPADGDPVSFAAPIANNSKPAVAVVPPVPAPVVPPPVSVPVAVAPVVLEPEGRESGGGSAQSSIQYSEKVRIVSRVGKVVRSLEPQSPSHYQLRSPQRGEGMLGFLLDQKDTQTPVSGFRGKTVRVVAEEYVDPRYRTQVILRVQSIEEASAR